MASPQPARQSCWQILAPLALGVAVFCLLVGMAPLNPFNLQWFANHDDTIQAWLGWTFFRSSPWTWPPGLNPAYGLELGNAIIYTDSIPLLAIVFKLFRAILPVCFQYLGWWLLMCFIFQAWFAWKLLKLVLPGFWAPLTGVLLFLFAPIFFIRLAGHYTLVGQFLILAALYLCLKPADRASHYYAWLGLLALSALIHAYLLFMVGALWWADLLNRWRMHNLSFWALVQNGVAGLLVSAFCCFLAGYFAISPGGAGGFGLYKMNLLAPFDPDATSYILPDIPTSAGEGEGYNFLGLGSLLLLLLACYSICRSKVSLPTLFKSWWPLLLSCAILTALALSNVVGISSLTIEFPVSEALDRWLQPVFRASGRFFWPVNYLMVFASIYILFRSWPYKNALVILVIAVILQVGDTSKRWWSQSGNGQDYLAQSPMRSLFWRDLPYKKLRILPLQNVRSDWKPLSIFAALHGMQTDAVYVSRIDPPRMHAITQCNEQRIAERRFDSDTLYILDEETFEKLRGRVPGALMENIDGFYILAPDYFTQMGRQSS